jgi:RNA polymerase sigma-70 factor (ECF subfamily)
VTSSSPPPGGQGASGIPPGKGPSVPVPEEVLANIFRQESRRVLATLIRLLGDFELAEDALQEACAIALDRWPREGIPSNPRSWLISTGRFRGIDTIRRRTRHAHHLERLTDEGATPGHGSPPSIPDGEAPELLEDDRLRLIFTCCHPALALDARVALTLREVCGLTTEEIAHAFLTRPTTLAQRIVRAKRKIRDAGIPYVVPEAQQLPQRLGAVLRVVYLVFNEGYSAASGSELVRGDLCAEAIHLGRLLVDLLPDPEVQGLLALMLLHEARRETRTTPEGELVRLEDQDRSRWNRDRIAEGSALVEGALRSRRFGPYTLQAAIAAVHAEAPTAEATDWAQITGLYDVLVRVEPNPVVELNRAVAVAMRDGPARGLALVEELLGRGELADYHLAHATRGELCRRLRRIPEALASYGRALELVQQEPERRFLLKRMAELERPGGTAPP